MGTSCRMRRSSIRNNCTTADDARQSWAEEARDAVIEEMAKADKVKVFLPITVMSKALTLDGLYRTGLRLYSQLKLKLHQTITTNNGTDDILSDTPKFFGKVDEEGSVASQLLAATAWL